jgi:hypothetical protein
LPDTFSDSPAPIIILGTGRSFTSVICSMIGQHPDMIGFPETNIFRDLTLGEVYDRFGKGGAIIRRSGLLRALAHYHHGSQTEETIDEAEIFVLEHEHWTFVESANYFRKLAAPKGIVEKSISTCRNIETLARVLEAWPDARFIHITRQPEAITKSMQSRVDDAVEKGKGKRLTKMLQTRSFDQYFNVYTSTILGFMATLPPGRGMNLHGEDFLSDARLYARQICEWAGLDASDAAIERMMHPEDNPFAFKGPDNAKGGMSATFLENPQYSGKPMTVKPLSFGADDVALDPERRSMAIFGNRLGYL